MAIESIVNFYPCKDIEETTEFYVNIIGFHCFKIKVKREFLTVAMVIWNFVSMIMEYWQRRHVFRLI